MGIVLLLLFVCYFPCVQHWSILNFDVVLIFRLFGLDFEHCHCSNCILLFHWSLLCSCWTTSGRRTTCSPSPWPSPSGPTSRRGSTGWLSCAGAMRGGTQVLCDR